ncbi:MAG: hypothetical protein LBP59_01660 [Planctomycetaceae bacterium]|jgi:hypothetical protein|nr:hypothetical protein [Planctomycetaceae bacterium]
MRKVLKKIDKSGKKVRTSLIVNADVHRRIRELTGFDYGGFSHFLDISLRVMLPFVELYHAQHKREFRDFDKNILLSIADDNKTKFDYEAIGQQVVSAIRTKTKEVFDGGQN